MHEVRLDLAFEEAVGELDGLPIGHRRSPPLHWSAREHLQRGAPPLHRAANALLKPPGDGDVKAEAHGQFAGPILRFRAFSRRAKASYVSFRQRNHPSTCAM